MNPGFSQALSGPKWRFLWLGLGLPAAIALIWLPAVPGKDQKIKLGGDVEITTIDTPLSIAADAYMNFNSAGVSRVVDLEARARTLPGKGEQLVIPVMFKGVDANYPLYGALKVSDQKGKALLFSNHRRRVYGAAVDRSLLEALHLKTGDLFLVGQATFRAQAVIENEPDRPPIPDPRVLVNMIGLKKTGLLDSQQSITYRYRATLPKGVTPERWLNGLKETFPDATWETRSWKDVQ